MEPFTLHYNDGNFWTDGQSVVIGGPDQIEVEVPFVALLQLVSMVAVCQRLPGFNSDKLNNQTR